MFNYIMIHNVNENNHKKGKHPRPEVAKVPEYEADAMFPNVTIKNSKVANSNIMFLLVVIYVVR
jgi:hypothetical protein